MTVIGPGSSSTADALPRGSAAQGPSPGLALAIVGGTFFFYILFNYFRVGDELYDWSKTLASYDYRQYLGMSKRWAIQYGHIVFLFVFLVMSKYIFVSDAKNERLSKFIRATVRYTLPIFIFHFPLLYFFTAITDHDPFDPLDQVFLFFAVLAACIVCGKLCFMAKPAFDRLQKGGERYLSRWFPGAEDSPPLPGAKLTRSFSNMLNLIRMVATLSIFFGHFTFAQFSDAGLPGFDLWRRWAVPFFFMTSGYFALRALERRQGSVFVLIFNRYSSLWFMVVPMLLVIPIIDYIGFQADPLLYFLHEKYISPDDGLRSDLGTLVWTFVNSALYLNEIFLYDLLGFGTELGGMRSFSNDSFWFLCYLMPFTAMLAVMIKVSGWRKYLWLAILAVFFGPPILLLAPLFFSGCLAYLIHKQI
ncbi:MAG: acyltransferase family protein [Kiloniellales bacterium]|nr:acyltransferase family protein [Kiloniellales bacterium]